MLNEYYAQNRGKKLASFFKYEDVGVDLCRECELILANVITARIDGEKK